MKDTRQIELAKSILENAGYTVGEPHKLSEGDNANTIKNRDDAIRLVKVGTRVKNMLGHILEVMEIDGLLYTLKYVEDDGTVSSGSGSVGMVPTHFVGYEIVQ